MISFSVKKANSKTISLTYIFIDPNVFFFKNFRYVISGLHNQKTAIFMRAKESWESTNNSIEIWRRHKQQ